MVTIFLREKKGLYIYNNRVIT